MKKLLVVLAFIGLVTLPTSGATFTHQSFLNAKFLLLDNDNQTNSFTNLTLAARIVGVTYSNAIGSIFTNSIGTSNKVAAGTMETFNTLGGVNLWPKQDGSWEKPTWASTIPLELTSATNVQSIIQTTNFNTDCSLLVEVYGESGWDGGMSLVFYPGYKDTITGEDIVATGGSAAWSLTIPHAALTGRSCIITNVPTYKWPGAERLYLYTIKNDDSTAADHVGVYRVELIGWKP